MKLLASRSADGAIICRYRTELQAHTFEDAGVSIKHDLIRLFQALRITVK